MINADNIGKRIRMLRKQKHISQERMAEELGMYQADISNLERAMSGSGISDLFKLEAIADYFDITLVDLLTGFEKQIDTPASEIEKAEEPKMNDYIIAKANYGKGQREIKTGPKRIAPIFASEIKLIAPDSQELYVSFSEYDDRPRFYKTSSSSYELILFSLGNAKCEKEIKKSCFLSGEDYIDIFQKVEPDWINICRYLIFIATEDEESVNLLIDKTVGKTLGEIDLPVPSREPEDLFYVNYSDLSAVYRYRLMVEADLKNPSIYNDLENTKKREKAILEKLKSACASEDAYKVWKKDLIDAKTNELMEKQNIIVCTYIFAGIGQYREILPEEMLDSFMEWINGNGSAFFCGSRKANRREIRTYVSQHIADKLLGYD